MINCDRATFKNSFKIPRQQIKRIFSFALLTLYFLTSLTIIHSFFVWVIHIDIDRAPQPPISKNGNSLDHKIIQFDKRSQFDPFELLPTLTVDSYFWHDDVDLMLDKREWSSTMRYKSLIISIVIYPIHTSSRYSSIYWVNPEDKHTNHNMIVTRSHMSIFKFVFYLIAFKFKRIHFEFI